MTDDALREEKRLLRKICKEKSSRLSPEYLQTASRQITSRLLDHPAYRDAKALFVYISMPGEPDTRPLIEHAWASKKTVYVPRCCGQGRMDAVALSSWESLAPGKLGIPEPQDGPVLEAGRGVDLCVIPCVCADRTGRRLGHGAGYYDRWLIQHPGTRLCLCFDRLLTDQVPTEPTDIPMDEIMTESGCYGRMKKADK